MQKARTLSRTLGCDCFAFPCSTQEPISDFHLNFVADPWYQMFQTFLLNVFSISKKETNLENRLDLAVLKSKTRREDILFIL